MSRLFESFEELDNSSSFRRIPARQSFALALMAAFIVGGQVVIIASIVHSYPNSGDLVEEVFTAALWLILGVAYGRAAWDRINQ